MVYQLILIFIFNFFNLGIIIFHVFDTHIFSQELWRFWSTCLFNLPRLCFSMSICLSLWLYDIVWCRNSWNLLLRRRIFRNHKALFVWHWSSIRSWTQRWIGIDVLFIVWSSRDVVLDKLIYSFFIGCDQILLL